MKHTSIAIDIGGTRIKIALLTDGKTEAFAMIPANSDGKLADRLPDIEKEVHQMLSASSSETAFSVTVFSPDSSSFIFL